jgi:hypothetical protein
MLTHFVLYFDEFYYFQYKNSNSGVTISAGVTINSALLYPVLIFLRVLLFP